MVELPAFAVPPISISRMLPDGLELTVRAVGPATSAVTSLPLGAQISLRGPMGRGWPVAEAYGRDVVIVAGGIGLAPLRPLIDRDPGRAAELRRRAPLPWRAHARRPPLRRTRCARLAGRADLQVAEIVDRAGPEWTGRVGVVTQLFDQATWNGARVDRLHVRPRADDAGHGRDPGPPRRAARDAPG